jgi:hypothetical protein
MYLLPQISQEAEDPYFIITRKTLGGEFSFFSRIASLFYSKNAISGRLLKAEILNADEITLNPGEKIEKILEIREGLIVPKQINIQFTSFGETVLEQQVKTEQETVSGTAVDINTDENLIDLYAVLVPAETYINASSTTNSNSLTGAAVSDLLKGKDYYMLEVSISSKEDNKPLFAEVYGPYLIYKQQSLVFGQQLKYKPEVYSGKYILRTKIYEQETVVVEDEQEIELG